MTNLTAPASPAGDGSTVTAVSPPPPPRYGVRYWSRTKHTHVVETCWDMDAINARLRDIRRHVDADACLVRQTGSGVWRLYTPPAVTS